MLMLSNTRAQVNDVKMSHRDVNIRRIESCSARVRYSPETLKKRGSGFLQRLASAWCASRSGSQSVGLLGAVEDR